jgi:hypothetical protein
LQGAATLCAVSCSDFATQGRLPSGGFWPRDINEPALGELTDYQLAHSVRADLCWRMNRKAEVRSSNERALALTQLEPERRFPEKSLRELG